MTIDAPASGATATTGRDPVLSARSISVHFGGITALDDVSIDVPRGQCTGLVGPNGAGKSTMFAVLSGLLRPDRGRVLLDGEDVSRRSPQARARRGLARTFQQPELFPWLTVREHLLLADRVRHARSRLWRDTFLAGSLRRESSEETERIDALLELLLLTGVQHDAVDSLPLGTSRLVEIARALATSPSVVLLDEPFSGLTAHETEELAPALRAVVAERDVGLVLVEHDVPLVLELCPHVFVLDFGRLIAHGTPNEIRSSAAVRDAYLGDEGAETSRSHRRREP